ncbi:lantibiotic protection ABC transporter ATP-binding protein [Bacillus velezensis]|uniref:lantibiotic protection ABC transporter ATP-binding protein n=1 Tax=Bacillus velezensis TaxID=492670 RepID=UPI000C226336|nr:lantibiotic protection ABC transporter ATP-binding protein [Bacillus velezensis]ATY29724.1 lantibiotic ABC transporter ATP-binding protein [Bacillus velezensis]
MSNIIETRQLQKSFGRQQAVADVSLSVKRNSIYGLLGPNGAGKSTTLKILTGMLQQTSGEVLFDGHTWKREDLKSIGSLIEAPPLYSNLTAAENMKVRCVMLGLPDSRIAEVLEITGLTGIGKKRAGQFSMGMKQRLGIALALLSRPSLLILDEPTNGLDPMGIQDLREFIRSLPGQGMTVILSSHLLSEVEQIADHIGIISDGVLGYQGEISREDDLEQLFLEVVKSTREKAGTGK